MTASRAPLPCWRYAQALAAAVTCCDQFATSAPAEMRCHACSESALFCFLPLPLVFSKGPSLLYGASV